MDEAVSGENTFLVEFRHDIHQHPEPGFKEVRTGEKIKEALNDIVGEPKVYAQTGLVFTITGTGAPSDKPITISLRADMDALTMTEKNPDLPYRSSNEGIAHMCGHDLHMACLTGAGRILQRNLDKIPSNCSVQLLYQPAEEGPGGAEPMIEEGCLEGVDEIYGMHNWPVFPLGTLAVKHGAFMANVGTFEIQIDGKGGHASAPHMVIDPVICACSVVTAFQTIISRNKSPLQPAILSVSTIHGGERHNVIPDTVYLSGTTRNVDGDTAELIKRRIEDTLKHICALHECTYEIKWGDEIGHASYPPVINHETETAHIVDVAKSVGLKVTSDHLPSLAAEDFAFFLQKKPGCFFFLGCACDHMCHSSHYDADDDLLPIGVKFWLSLVEHRLGVKLF